MNIKYISSDHIDCSARDAEVLTELDFGSLLPSQEKTLSFRLGNLDEDSYKYYIGVTTVNSGIVEDLELSNDKCTFVPLENGVPNVDAPTNIVRPDEISEPIYIKIHAPDDAFISDGTFRVTVSGEVC